MLFAIETSCGHKHADFRQGFPLAVSANSAVQAKVNEGRWGRSEGHIGSMKVECKSAWLLHFAAALSIRLALAT